MTISCEINLKKQFNDVFLPGETISGVIKYKFHEEATFNKVVVSLKGKETLLVDGTCQTTKCANVGNKNYVDINEVICEKEKGVIFPAGTYETQFSFTLPSNISGSLTHKKNTDGYSINYKLFYYVRIKFERPGLLRHSKSFKKSITVTSDIISSLPTTPFTYKEEKRLIKLFSRREDVVSIKATLEKSVVACGGGIHVKCEVKNETNFNIKDVEVKLVEAFQLKAADIAEEVFDVLHSTNIKTSLANRGDTEVFKAILDVPTEALTVRNSKLMSRNYFVHISAVLPAFYKNAVLKVPIEVEKNTINNYVAKDIPPSYWDAMNSCEQGERNEP